MIRITVFLLSFSAIAFEILLSRIFSISQWNHLSFMVISIALFGFAVSGTLLSLIETRKNGYIQQLSTRETVFFITALYTFTVIASLWILNQIPLDYFRISLETVQIFYLLLAYLLLSLPFFFTGIVISIAYVAAPHKSGTIYLLNMAGSAMGAALPVFYLSFWDEGRLAVFAALIPLAAALFYMLKMGPDGQPNKNTFSWKQKATMAFGFVVVCGGAFLALSAGNVIMKIKPSSYKPLSQTLQFPETLVAETFSSVNGRIDHVKSPFIRIAPGLSLKFAGRLPDQSALFKDGDTPLVLYDLNANRDANFARDTLPYAGYLLNASIQNTLVIQNGGGVGILCAIAAGSGNITVIEADPNIANLLRQHYGLSIINKNHRVFLSQSDRRFNVIHIDNMGTSLPGLATLNQEHSFTLEALTAYFQHLTENGIILIARKLLLPPADSLRLWASAYESLRRNHIKSPEQHLIMLRNWDTFVFLISAKPFHETKTIENFARNKNFDLVYLPGKNNSGVNRFNKFDEPYHFNAIKRLERAYLAGTEKKFFSTYPLDVRPQTDQRPFPSRFMKWTRLREVYQSTGGRVYSLFVSGEIVVGVVLIEAFCISLVLLILPGVFSPKNPEKPSALQVLYFFLIGIGFMFVEIYFIKMFIVLLDNPVTSFSVVLCGILIFSGIGGCFAQKINPKDLKYTLSALLAVLVGLSLGLPPLIQWMLSASDFWRYLAAILLLLPPGILMGLPFPSGMRFLLKSPYQRANAWAVNGCASVLSAIMAAQIALGLGISFILTCAILAYLATLMVSLKFNSSVEMEGP